MIYVDVLSLDDARLYVNAQDAETLGLKENESGQIIETDEEALNDQLREIADDLGFVEYDYSIVHVSKTKQDLIIKKNLMEEKLAREVKYQIFLARDKVKSSEQRILDEMMNDGLEARFLSYVYADAEQAEKKFMITGKITSLASWKESGRDRRYRQRRRRIN